jgi:hypothetical protein
VPKSIAEDDADQSLNRTLLKYNAPYTRWVCVTQKTPMHATNGCIPSGAFQTNVHCKLQGEIGLKSISGLQNIAKRGLCIEYFLIEETLSGLNGYPRLLRANANSRSADFTHCPRKDKAPVLNFITIWANNQW